MHFPIALASEHHGIFIEEHKVTVLLFGSAITSIKHEKLFIE